MIYLDHHATTPMWPEAIEAVRECMVGCPGNPASPHGAGKKARQQIEAAREAIAAALGAKPEEILFTSGATEANNLAITSLAGRPPGRIVASMLEHPCVYEPIKALGKQGFTIEWAKVDVQGRFVIQDEQLSTPAALIALMLVNHETGAIQPVADVVAQAHPSSAIHCDAVQAVGKIPVNFQRLGVTTLSLSGHKFGGPKGVGALLVRHGKKLAPQLFGGHQQQGIRPGTENVAGIVGMAKALEISLRQLEAAHRQMAQGRELFIQTLQQHVSAMVVNSPADGSPYVVNISFPGCRAELLLMKLDLAGIACSTGSACTSGSLLPSPVLQAMNVPDEVLRSAMRFSFSARQTQAELIEAAQTIGRCVEKVRGVG